MNIDIEDFKDCRIKLLVEELEREQCNFFYDESNNGRKLKLEEDDFNISIDKDFALGGIMYFGENNNTDIRKLKEDIKLQKNAKEVKLKHIAPEGSTFLDCLKEKKVNTFLNWLYKSDLYVHYSITNNFYFAIVDIVDSVITEVEIKAYGIDGINLLKNELYKLMKKNYGESYSLLRKYNYPNVQSCKVNDFCNEIINMIYMEEFSCVLEALRQALQVGSQKDNLIFLSGNKQNTILEDYSNLYSRPLRLFKDSVHTFDEECIIEEELSKYLMKHGNYEFIKSTDNEFIQVSDLFIGLIGKYYSFLNEYEIDEITKKMNELNEIQKNTLSLFARLIYKSDEKSKLLIHSINSVEQKSKFEIVLDYGKKFAKRAWLIEMLS